MWFQTTNRGTGGSGPATRRMAGSWAGTSVLCRGPAARRRKRAATSTAKAQIVIDIRCPAGSGAAPGPVLVSTLDEDDLDDKVDEDKVD